MPMSRSTMCDYVSLGVSGFMRKLQLGDQGGHVPSASPCAWPMKLST